MEDNKKFPEQEAPEKNTDDAFVKVGEDGRPDLSGGDDKKDEKLIDDDKKSQEKQH